MTVWTPSAAQVALVKSLLDQRVPQVEHANWLYHIRREVTSNARMSDVINALWARPVLLSPTYITQVGYYRNPEDGTLYRLMDRKEGLRVAVYSKTGGPRRLSVEGNLTKGKWVEKGKFDSRRLQYKVSPDWFITEEALLEYAYGFCPLHGGPLSDGVSVALGRGPKCSEKHGLEWSESAAREVLKSQGIDPDKFLDEHRAPVKG